MSTIPGAWRKVVQGQNQTPATAFYAIGLFLPAASWIRMWTYASRAPVAAADRLLGTSGFGLAVCVGLPLLDMLPPKTLDSMGEVS